jgi:hypothetical protein
MLQFPLSYKVATEHFATIRTCSNYHDHVHRMMINATLALLCHPLDKPRSVQKRSQRADPYKSLETSKQTLPSSSCAPFEAGWTIECG